MAKIKGWKKEVDGRGEHRWKHEDTGKSLWVWGNELYILDEKGESVWDAKFGTNKEAYDEAVYIMNSPNNKMFNAGA